MQRLCRYTGETSWARFTKFRQRACTGRGRPMCVGTFGRDPAKRIGTAYLGFRRLPRESRSSATTSCRGCGTDDFSRKALALVGAFLLTDGCYSSTLSREEGFL